MFSAMYTPVIRTFFTDSYHCNLWHHRA